MQKANILKPHVCIFLLCVFSCLFSSKIIQIMFVSSVVFHSFSRKTQMFFLMISFPESLHNSNLRAAQTALWVTVADSKENLLNSEDLWPQA